MPQLEVDDTRQHLLQAGQKAKTRASRFWNGFSDFALQDNVLEVAVGLILAAAFTAVVTSFVSDVLLPVLSLLPFIDRNFDEKFAVLRAGPNYDEGPGRGYNTIKSALDDGAVVMSWGTFINKVFNFIGIGVALYTVALVYGWASNDSVIKHTVKCKYCRKRISEKAQRCVNCTSWQDGRESIEATSLWLSSATRR
ncbi:ion channel [Usnea florida]